MPLATHPGATYEIILDSDRCLEESNQPVFIFRYLSVLKWQVIAKLNDEFETLTDSDTMIDMAFDVINRVLCDWRNMITPDGKTLPFNPEKLKAMVTLGEATELMQAAVAQRPTPADKKKSDSQSASNTDRSVKTARGRKRAKTNRTKLKP